jgi:hypothetical protein
MADSRTLPEDHDAQREMEQRSLRNVRSLLDRLEREAELERRTHKRVGWLLVVIMVVALGGISAWLSFGGHAKVKEREIVIAPAQR